MADKTVTVLLQAVTGPYQAAMAKAATSTASVGTAAKGTQAGVGRLTGSLGPAALTAAKTAAAFAGPAALAYGLHSSAKAAIGFESDFARVRKTVDGTPQQLDGISKGFRTMSTQMPATTSELTAVGEAAGQLEIKTGAVLGFTEVAAQMGETTNLSADEAATSMARLANITQMPQSEFKNLGSAIVALGNNFAANEQEILEFGTRLAASGAQVGLTEGDILGLGAALAAVGVNAEAGGTALSRVMSELDVAVANGGDSLEQFADVAGTTAEQFAEQWRKDPSDALISFVEGLGKIEKAGGNVFQVLDDLGLADQRVRRSLLSMAGAGDQLRSAVELGNEEFRKGTALQNEYAVFAGTTQAKIDMLGNSVHNLAIEVGEGLAPAYGHAAVAGAGLLNSTTELLQGLSGESGGGFWDRVGLNARTTLRTALGINAVEGAFDKLTGRVDVSAAAMHEAERFAGRYSGLLPEVTHQQIETAAAAVESARALKDLSGEQADLADAVSQFIDPLQVYQQALSDKESKERKAAEATAAATKSGKDSWEDYAGNVKVSLSDYNDTLRKQLRDQRAWADNLRVIAKEVGPDVAAELASMGVEGAGLVAQMRKDIDGEGKETARLLRKWARQGGKDAVTALQEELANAAREADQGGKNISDNLSARVTTMRKNVGREMNQIPPHVRDTMDDAERRADRGGKDTADTLTARVKTGRKDVGRLLNEIPPHMRESMSNTRDRARTGADNVGAAMNRELAQRARKWARIVAGYGDSLSAGLNPILRALKAGTISSPHDASIRAIERATGAMAEGGFRPDAHIANTTSVIYGEPETGGEAYIPFAASKRPRSRAIADETVSRLGGQVQWFAKGGFNSPGDVPKVPAGDGTVLGQTARAAMKHARSETVDWLEENLAPAIGGGPGRWRQMWAAVHGRFPWAQLISAFRPGAITATGNASYHGMGRAIDITPSMKIFDWIRKNYAATELIYSPAGGRQEWHGAPHYYTGITRAMHFNHVHWAMAAGGIITKEIMRALGPRLGAPAGAGADLDLLAARTFDSGGLLQPGATTATNNTGSAEIVAAQGMIADEVSKGITNALTGKLPRVKISVDTLTRRLPTKDVEAVAQRWQLAWEFGITSTSKRLKQLRQLMVRAVPWSEEWVALFRERQEIVQSLLDDAVAGVEAALQEQAEAFDNLNQLLDERGDVMQRIGDVQLAFEERRSELIEARRDSLLSAMQPEQRMERVWANSMAAVTRNVQGQVEDFAQWAEGLDLLRSMGLSEDAVSALGLEDFTAESLATVQLWSNATQGEVDALNVAIASRQKSASDQATSEADRMLGGIGDQLLALTRETADEIAGLQQELADIGMDTGRGYAQALAEGLSSGIPGIVDAARAAQEAVAGVAEAEGTLSQARQTAKKEPAAGTATSVERAPLARLYKTPDAGYYVRFSDPPQWARVVKSKIDYARKLWGPQVAYPNNKPKTLASGKYINDVLGWGWWNRYTLRNTALKSEAPAFARGGIVTGPTYFGLGGGLGLMGEAGTERITPLSRDVTSPHEDRAERHMKQMEAHTKRIADGIQDALDRGDTTIVLDTGVVAGAVTKNQRGATRREMVAAGQASWGRSR